MINLENMFLDTPFSGRLNGISPTYGYNIYIYILSELSLAVNLHLLDGII
jgi:hypothetical protein